MLLAPRLTGLYVHKWLGIAFAVPVGLHLLLASRWVNNTAAVLRSSTPRTRVNFLLNAILFILVVIEFLSGMVISRVALPAFGVLTVNDRVWRMLHNHTLNVLVLAAGLHLAMNWRWVVAAVKSRHGQASPARAVVWFFQPVRFGLGILLAATLICAAVWALAGSPSARREYRQDEIARFRPTVAHGLVQFCGEALLVAGAGYAGRRWLRVRL